MSGRRREFLSLVIPAYNEELRIGQTLRQAYDWLRARFDRFEIVVVDDGSADRTAEIVREFALGAPEVRLLQSPRNIGKGHAVRTGMLATTGDYALFSDADLSTPIGELDRALALLTAGNAAAIASRALPDSNVQVHQSALREAMGKMFNWIVRRLCHLPFLDTQCGFKGYSRSAAEAIFTRARIDGFAFDVESLVIARRLGLSVADFPVRWINSPSSKVRMLRHPVQMIWEVVQVRRNEQRGYYDR